MKTKHHATPAAMAALAALPALLLGAGHALAQSAADQPEPHVDMVWVWIFVALFVGSIVLVGWMMWRGERAERARQKSSAESPGKAS